MENIEMTIINNYPNQYSLKKYNNTAFKQNYNYSSSSKTKRLAIGASSLIVPGLGQIINGETSKGVAFFLATICNGLLCYKKRQLNTICKFSRLGISGWAAIDAYKKS